MVQIKNYNKSDVRIVQTIESCQKLLSKHEEEIVVITDENVFSIYSHFFEDFSTIVLSEGEQAKSISDVESIVDSLLEIGLDRNGLIVGIGGGVVCDIAGFVASIYLRGVKCGYVPTTLLAMVDASIGGKTGINYGGFKNILGTFSQPLFVYSCLEMLQTLAPNELKNGLVESIKHAIIADAELFQYILENVDKIYSLDIQASHFLVKRSIEIKVDIVNQDEKEGGIRKVLNLGHTIGHALESKYGIPHGEAVSYGIRKSAQISANQGYCSSVVAKKIMDIFVSIGLPDKEIDPDFDWKRWIIQDKKKNADSIDYIYIEDIGRVKIEKTPIDSLIRRIGNL